MEGRRSHKAVFGIAGMRVSTGWMTSLSLNQHCQSNECVIVHIVTWNQLSRSFFQTIYCPSSCLHHLLPPLSDTSVICRLQSTTSFPRPTTRTKKYQSFI